MKVLFQLQHAFALALLFSHAPLRAGCWVDSYWPLNGGDSRSFTRDVTVYTEDMGFGEFWISQETPDSYVYEIHHKTAGKIYFDCAKQGFVRVCVSPDVLLFDDDLLQRGGSRTTRTTASQSGVEYPATFTISVSIAGTVTVPAGTFQNCRNVTVRETAQPPGQPSVSATVLTAVLAPHVGFIKKRVSLDDKLVWVELTGGTIGGIAVATLANQSANLPPAISRQPRDVTVLNSDVATFSVSALGQGLGYQWWKDGIPLVDDGRIIGAASATLTLNPVQYADAGAYSVRISNSACAAVSSDARLTVLVADRLALVTNGLGAIARNFAGDVLVIGSTQMVTAMPASGQLFSNWTDGAGVVLTNRPALKFIMQSNLVLVANFVPNPFPSVAGNYNGLYFVADSTQHGSSGAVKGKVDARGGFSASLQNGKAKYPFSGRFEVDGTSSNVVRRSGSNSLNVQLRIDFSGGDRISGLVSDGNGTADLLANRALFNAATNPATNFAPQYTLLIPGDTNGSLAQPAGDGFASVKISRAGAANIQGALADGSPFTLSVPISKNGDLPSYASLYGGKGSALGWLKLEAAGESDITGRIAWFKPTPSRAPYTNGFAVATDVLGSAYTPFGREKLFDVTNATLTFSDGGLPEPFLNSLTLGPGGTVTNAGTNKLTFHALSASGLFNGSFVLPGGNKSLLFKGALLEKQMYGGGYFLNANQSGRVELGP